MQPRYTPSHAPNILMLLVLNEKCMSSDRYEIRSKLLLLH